MQGMLLIAFVSLALFNLYPMLWLARGSLRGPEGELSLVHYGELLTSLGPLEATKNSLIFAFWSIVIGLVLALAAALSTTRLQVPFSGFVRTMSVIAFVNPPWITAMAYGWLLSPQAGMLNQLTDYLFGIKPFNAYSLITMCFVGGLFLYPYLYLVLTAALANMDASYEEAALTSGATPLQTLRMITMPLVTPAMITSIVFSVVMLWGSFAIPAILGTPARTYVFATYLYQLLRTFPPQLELSAAIAVFFALTAGVLVAVVLRIVRSGYGGKYHVIGGKGRRDVRLEASNRLRRSLSAFNLFVVFLALVLPYSLILRMSLSDSVYGGVGLDNVSLRHYVYHFNHPAFLEILRNTLVSAVVVAVVAGFISLLVAYLDLRGKGRLKELVSPLATFPIAVPAVALVIGVAIGWLRSPVAIYGTIWIIIVCQIARFMPLGVQNMRDGFNQLHPDLEDAARTCGAPTRTLLRRISLPIVRPVAVATLMLLWMAAMRDLLTPLFLGTGTPQSQTLSYRVFYLWGEGLVGQSAALAIILIVVMAVLYWLLSLLLLGRPAKVTRSTGSGQSHGPAAVAT